MLSEVARGGHVVREPVGTLDADDCAALREIQDDPSPPSASVCGFEQVRLQQEPQGRLKSMLRRI
jgi:hypothetical protein